MKAIGLAAMLTLGGCGVMQTVAPHTTAGFREGGVLGAVQGVSGALLVTCRTLSGAPMRVAVGNLADATGAMDELAKARAIRQQACAAIGAVHVISNGMEESLPALTVHRAITDGTPDIAQGTGDLPLARGERALIEDFVDGDKEGSKAERAAPASKTMTAS